MLQLCMKLAACVPETVVPLEQLALLDFARNQLLFGREWPAFTLGRSHLLRCTVALVPFLFQAVTWDVPFVRITRFLSRAWVPI